MDCDSVQLSLAHQVPMARASILWLLGEYAERVPKIAPDVLRNMAKTFGSEVHFVYRKQIAVSKPVVKS